MSLMSSLISVGSLTSRVMLRTELSIFYRVFLFLFFLLACVDKILYIVLFSAVCLYCARPLFDRNFT
jgi:hypothetical protein